MSACSGVVGGGRFTSYPSMSTASLPLSDHSLAQVAWPKIDFDARSPEASRLKAEVSPSRLADLIVLCVLWCMRYSLLSYLSCLDDQINESRLSNTHVVHMVCSRSLANGHKHRLHTSRMVACRALFLMRPPWWCREDDLLDGRRLEPRDRIDRAVAWRYSGGEVRQLWSLLAVRALGSAALRDACIFRKGAATGGPAAQRKASGAWG